MNKVYLAAPIFTPHQLSVVSHIEANLKLQEWNVFSPYRASREIWNGRAPKDCTHEERSQVVQLNIDGLSWAELLLCWVGGTDNGKTDTGVVWEMGYFKALNKGWSFTLAYIDSSDHLSSMNLMLAETVDAVAYGPAQLMGACGLLSSNKAGTVREQFNPQTNMDMLHEKDPIS